MFLEAWRVGLHRSNALFQWLNQLVSRLNSKVFGMPQDVV